MSQDNPFSRALGRPKMASMDNIVSVPKQDEPSPSPPLPPARSRKVFVVHGHNSQVLDKVSNFLLKAKYEPIILKDESFASQFLLNELVKNTRNLAFAIVIMTADDEGRLKGEPKSELKDRARQNVIFEFGYLLRVLPRNKVYVLREHGLDMPSDFDGVFYIPYDEPGAWQMPLVKAVKAAGIPLNTKFLTG
ncbi:MAG: nucleotide-binding protein [Chloroflexota bacterium]